MPSRAILLSAFAVFVFSAITRADNADPKIIQNSLSLEKAVAQADAVFVGRVTVSAGLTLSMYTLSQNGVTVSVSRVLHGSVGARTSVCDDSGVNTVFLNQGDTALFVVSRIKKVFRDPFFVLQVLDPSPENITRVEKLWSKRAASPKR